MGFAVNIVCLYKMLIEEKKEYVLSKQLLRSGTSIGANLVEAQHGVSEKDFLSKIYISLKETAETEYWLELLHKTNYNTTDEYKNIAAECNELYRMLNSITKTIKQKLNT